MTGTVLIAIHDVAPATLAECRLLVQWVRALDAGAPVTLLCVPRFHDGLSLERSVECRRWIDSCVARGDEVVLHGYVHRDEGRAPSTAREWCQRRLLTAREGEFATLDAVQVRDRVERGVAMFSRCGWNAVGFVPPAWLMNAAATPALRASALRYCTDTTGFQLLHEGQRMDVPVIGTSARSHWRRLASRAWLATAVSRMTSSDCVRVALHPEDARHPEMRAAWQRALERLLLSRQPLTKWQWLTQSKSVGNVRST